MQSHFVLQNAQNLWLPYADNVQFENADRAEQSSERGEIIRGQRSDRDVHSMRLAL